MNISRRFFLGKMDAISTGLPRRQRANGRNESDLVLTLNQKAVFHYVYNNKRKTFAFYRIGKENSR
ncbi:hypothetical protein EDM54_03330 [Brevibacillus borstelensis]|nr:hypothetical protein EDM54_03330 [Brevibacillus borstelensis]